TGSGAIGSRHVSSVSGRRPGSEAGAPDPVAAGCHSVSGSSPVRVLHIIGSLGGGGSERLLWDAVRRSNPARVRHRVVTVYPDNGRFVYAARLAALGAHTPARSVWRVPLPGHPMERRSD